MVELEFVADFETTIPEKYNLSKSGNVDMETVDVEMTRVWAWGVCEIGNVDNFIYGTDLDSFFEWCKKGKNKVIWFHNLKFDGEFIIYHLMKNMQFSYSPSKRSKTFDVIISDMGQWYEIVVVFEKKNKQYKKVTFRDSLKKLPFKVEQIGKAFGLNYQKISVSDDFYTRHRDKNHQLTNDEIEYLKGDVQTVAAALGIQFAEGLDKLTIGVDCMTDFKIRFGKHNFEKMFPELPIEVDLDIRQAYRGGFTYLKDDYADIDLAKGVVYDRNSMYPATMKYCPMPYGTPIYFAGKYEKDPIYPLYIQSLTCTFSIKPDHLPTIQLKNNFRFAPTEYIKNSGPMPVDLVLTNVDLELFFSHYDVDVISYNGGWKFKSHVGFFDEYIDYWGHIKENSEGPKRQLAKLMLNNLYGKFGTNPIKVSKYPVLENGEIKYKYSDPKETKTMYIPVAVFVTAWARHNIITNAQKLYNRFVYADTDSLHLLGWDVPDGLDIDPNRLGAWSLDGKFRRARFLRAKTYIEEVWDDKKQTWELTVKCAGMPENVKNQVTWDNFQKGATFDGKLVPKRVRGGVVLTPTTFQIKG